MKKKTFLLLEILIGILIVSLCIIPLVQGPMRSYRAEMRHLEEMEGERLADWTFSEIREKLLKNELRWEQLPGHEAVAGPFPLPKGAIQIPGCPAKSIGRSFHLRCLKGGEREGPQGEIYRIMLVDVVFDPPLCKKNKYTYRVQAHKLPLLLDK